SVILGTKTRRRVGFSKTFSPSRKNTPTRSMPCGKNIAASVKRSVPHKDRFNIHEFSKRGLSEFAPVTALFDTAEGEIRIGPDVGVDRASSGRKPLRGQFDASFNVTSK